MNRRGPRHIRAGNRHRCAVFCGRLHGRKNKAHTWGRENNAFPFFFSRGNGNTAARAASERADQLADTDDPRIGRRRRRNGEMRGARTAAETARRRLLIKRRQKRTQGKGKHLRHKLAAAQPKPYSRADARPRLLGTLSVYTCVPVSSRTAPMFFENFFARICSRFQASLD